MRHLFKLKPHIKTLDDFTYRATSNMSFMLHPNFCISRYAPLSLSSDGVFKYFDTVISKSDVIEIPNDAAIEPAKYLHPTKGLLTMYFCKPRYCSRHAMSLLAESEIITN